jgi:uncharacterized protein
VSAGYNIGKPGRPAVLGSGVSKDYIGYDGMVDDALRGVVRDALLKIAEIGLVGGHHLYITFRTAYPGVEVPEYLAERYPDELTVVMQHQFWALEVTDEQFSVMLSFNKQREAITIPFAALTRFADPGVKFGLQFEPIGDEGAALRAPFRERRAKELAAEESTTEGVVHKLPADGEAGSVPSTASASTDTKTSDKTAVEDDSPDDKNRIVSLDSFRKK